MSNITLQFVSLAPSRYLRLYIVSLYGLVLVSMLYSLKVIWPSDWLPALMLPVATLTIVAATVHARRVLNTHCNQHATDFISGLSYANQQWQLHIAQTDVPVILRQATVWNWLIVLDCYGEVVRRDYTVVIIADSVSAEQHRRLRVLLRHIVSW